MLEYNGASGALQYWYAYGLGPNDVLNQMDVAGGGRATLVPDIQGSVIATLYSTAGPLSKLGYLPYGKSVSKGPFGYTGQRVDTETNGLYYYRARHYSPALGRFMQADPIGTQGGVNLYTYVGNDPLNFSDPNGLVKDFAVAAVSASAAPELAESQAVTDLIQQHPTVAMVEGGIGLTVPFAIVGAGAAGLLEAGAVYIANPIPATVARVIPEGIPATTLARPGAVDAFVTAAEDIAGMNSAQIAQRLSIPPSSTGFKVIEFPTPQSGLASPVFRTDPAFVGGGRTAGGAREFVVPNQPIPPNASIRTVR